MYIYKYICIYIHKYTYIIYIYIYISIYIKRESPGIFLVGKKSKRSNTRQKNISFPKLQLTSGKNKALEFSIIILEIFQSFLTYKNVYICLSQ